MKYCDFDFYIEVYKGSSVPNDLAFDKLSREAEAMIDSCCLRNRSFDDLPDNDKDNVRIAVCAVVDISYTQELSESGEITGAVASESVGNHSISYAHPAAKTTADYEREKYAKLRLYIPSYLFYRGLKYGR